MTAYEMAINNLKRYIRSNDPVTSKEPMNAFEAAFILSVAFCKNTDEVLADLIR